MCGSQREQSHGGLIHISVKGTFTLIPPKQMYSKDEADMKITNHVTHKFLNSV